MKILFCGMNYSPEMIAIGKYSTELCQYLADQGHEVEVITTPPHYPGWKVLPGYHSGKYRNEVIGGVRVRRAPMFLAASANGINRLLMPLSWAIMATPLVLWRALAWRPDVIVNVQPTITLAPSVLLAARLCGARSVQHVQDLELDAALAVGHINTRGRALKIAYAVERLITKAFDRTVTISHKMAERLKGKGAGWQDLFIVRNWVDQHKIGPLGRVSRYREELGIREGHFVVQYSGQMGRKQALHLVIDAAKILADDPRFVFVLAGDGPARPDIEQQARELPNVRLLPLQPADRLGEFLGLADCHILPQEKDVAELVLPSKLGGMLASGKRILITVDQDTELSSFLGRSVTYTAPGNVQAIASALQLMIDERDDTDADRAALAAELAAETLLPRFERILTRNDVHCYSLAHPDRTDRARISKASE